MKKELGSTTTFKKCKRGYLVKTISEHTEHLFYIPKTASVSVSIYGEQVTVRFGKALTLTMPYTMWAYHEDNIIAAAMGTDVKS